MGTVGTTTSARAIGSLGGTGKEDKHDEPAPGAYDGLTEQEIEQLEAEREALLKRLWTRPEGT